MTGYDEEFSQLVTTIDSLLEPNGCPWDRKQTVESLSPMVLEEICEVLDTLHDPDHEKFADELGDVWVTTLFLAKAAEREGRFSWKMPFLKGCEKLIRRHPHVFSKKKDLSVEEIEKQWQEVKATEIEHKHRKSRTDGISHSLPALSMVQKLFLKVEGHPELHALLEEVVERPSEDPAKEIGRSLAKIVMEAQQSGVQAELALRAFFSTIKDSLIEEEKRSCE